MRPTPRRVWRYTPAVDPALEKLRKATQNSEWEGELWLVGGAVRDQLLGLTPEADYDIVLRGSSSDLARFLFKQRVSSIPPVTYERFGTAMVRVASANVELVTARRESYESGSRKPQVEPATLEEDALRRDFTVNTLLRNLHTDELLDPLGQGQDDLKARVLRTPLEPKATFHDDPLRMLRAVRFRWKLGFEPAPGLYEAIREEAHRLQIISNERIRDEFIKVLAHPTAPDAMGDLMNLGLFAQFAPELPPMLGVEQGQFHHLDVWGHSLVVLQQAGHRDLTLSLAALLHDMAKPETRTIDEDGRTRFFGHETKGAKMAAKLLRRLRFPVNLVDEVETLIRNHMRLGTAHDFSPSAARRLLRDLGPLTPKLVALAEADAKGLKAGVVKLDIEAVKRRIAEVEATTPAHTLQSPLSGEEIMDMLGLPSGPEVGRWKAFLTERVLEGELAPDDKEGSKRLLLASVAESYADSKNTQRGKRKEP